MRNSHCLSVPRKGPETSTSLRTSLRVETLEDRVVPHGNVLNLISPGATGSIGGAYFSQLTEQPGELDPFLTVKPGHLFQFSERGYNTDARPVQFDAVSDPAATRALHLDEIPTVTRGGVDYRELILDIDQWEYLPLLTLDELRLYVSDRPDLNGYQSDGTLAGLQPVYDLDGQDNSLIWLNDWLNAGSGPGDMAMHIPEAVLSGKTYVYLYSRFGACWPATGGPEVWSVRANQDPGPPASIGGLVFNDQNGNSNQEDHEEVLPNRVVFLDNDDDGIQDETERAVTTAEDGSYHFADLLGGREYIVRVVTGPGEFAPRWPIVPDPGEHFPLDIGIFGVQP